VALPFTIFRLFVIKANVRYDNEVWYLKYWISGRFSLEENQSLKVYENRMFRVKKLPTNTIKPGSMRQFRHAAHKVKSTQSFSFEIGA
jgi:hypothetical protein